jgi:hypothetical protein
VTLNLKPRKTISSPEIADLGDTRYFYKVKYSLLTFIFGTRDIA